MVSVLTERNIQDINQETEKKQEHLPLPLQQFLTHKRSTSAPGGE